jgi:hypothetical protein
VRPDLAFFVDLERQVWEALRRGDAVADQALLSEDFLGVYDTGFADRAGHVALLASGPTMRDYWLDSERLLRLTPELTLLSYRAKFCRQGPERTMEAMFVSSLWRLRAGRWINVFSQDTAARN